MIGTRTSDGKPYTKSTLERLLYSLEGNAFVEYKQKISEWTTNVLKNKIDGLIESIRAYLEGQLSGYVGYSPINLEGFFDNTNGVPVEEERIQPSNNIYHTDDIEIEVGTVHSVKGETHAATLYLETSYYGKTDAEYLWPQFCGHPFTDNKKNHSVQALRIAYVAMSRPKYFLCYAVSKDHFHDDEGLRKLWDVVEI